MAGSDPSTRGRSPMGLMGSWSGGCQINSVSVVLSKGSCATCRAHERMGHTHGHGEDGVSEKTHELRCDMTRSYVRRDSFLIQMRDVGHVMYPDVTHPSPMYTPYSNESNEEYT